MLGWIAERSLRFVAYECNGWVVCWELFLRISVMAGWLAGNGGGGIFVLCMSMMARWFAGCFLASRWCVSYIWVCFFSLNISN